MTKEECIALLIRYAEYDGMGIPNLAGCKEAMRTAAELLSQPQPSLPSNLDEAAHNHAANNGGRWLTDDIGIKCFAFNPQEIEDAFKAGAEWMAGQGVSMPGKVDIYGVDVDSITDKLLEHGFKLGEEVVLQIRKK